MKKVKVSFILLFPIFTLILAVMLSGLSASASGDYGILLELQESQEETGFKQKADFEIWKIRDSISDNLEQIFDNIKSKSRKELIESYGEPVKKVDSQEKGEVEIRNLDRGTYLARDTRTGMDSGYYSPVIFSLPAYSSKKLNMKAVIRKPVKPYKPVDKPRNGAEFIKVADNSEKTPLQGAVFKVTRKEGEYYETIQKDGKDYIVTSGKDGRFYVEGLEYGDYYLWEIKPPDGYKSLSGNIKFTISAKSFIENKVIEIVNEKNPDNHTQNPPDNSKVHKHTPDTKKRISIPKTGDIMFMLLLLEGMVLILIGIILVRSSKKTDV